MEKPWDKLRVKPPEVKQPIGTGRFNCGPLFEVVRFPSHAYDATVDIRIGPPTNSDCRFCSCELRDVAAFFCEMADQLEGK